MAFQTVTGPALSVASTTNYAFGGFVPGPGSQVLVTQYSATSDKAATFLSFYQTSATLTATTATAAGQTFATGATAGVVDAGDYVLIQHVGGNGTGVNESAYVVSVGTTQVKVFGAGAAGATVYSIAVGDVFWAFNTDGATAIGANPVGAATVTASGDQLIAGDRGRALIAAVTGSLACTINSITANLAG